MKHTSVILTALLAFGLLGCSPCDGATNENWNKQCAKCHGKTGAADTALAKKLELKDYTNPESLKEFSDEDLFNMTKDGVEKTKMKGYATKLTDEEISDLVKYMREMS